jgi:receptor expression-enhancing protein 5/6
MPTFLQDLVGLLAILSIVGIIMISSRAPKRTRGREVKYQTMFAVPALVFFFLIPFWLKEILFTPLSVVIAGSVFPIYESLRAVCTIETTDDTAWLTYWIAQGTISFSTEWVDKVGQGTHANWYLFELLLSLWLLLPWTDGATLLFDFFLAPLVGPIIQPLVRKTDGILQKVILAVTNATHLSVVWIAFVMLPESLKRTIWILLGTVYPILSSIVVVTTIDGGDDTYWLTYWSCFGILFLILDFLDNFLGFIPGFYTIAIAATMYLMLPMFRGAETVFREILVPLAGMQEMLIRRDAEMLKRQVLANVPPERQKLVLNDIVTSLEDIDAKVSTFKTDYNTIV